jgi:hypothetical protein
MLYKLPKKRNKIMQPIFIIIIALLLISFGIIINKPSDKMSLPKPKHDEYNILYEYNVFRNMTISNGTVKITYDTIPIDTISCKRAIHYGKTISN